MSIKTEIAQLKDSRITTIPNIEPKIEPRSDFVIEKIADWFGHPCNFTFGDIGDVPEYMGDYCEDYENCKSEPKACWRKLFETMAKEGGVE